MLRNFYSFVHRDKNNWIQGDIGQGSGSFSFCFVHAVESYWLEWYYLTRYIDERDSYLFVFSRWEKMRRKMMKIWCKFLRSLKLWTYSVCGLYHLATYINDQNLRGWELRFPWMPEAFPVYHLCLIRVKNPSLYISAWIWNFLFSYHFVNCQPTKFHISLT